MLSYTPIHILLQDVFGPAILQAYQFDRPEIELLP